MLRRAQPCRTWPDNCVINDLSERAFQLEGTGQWVKGKICDTFGPIGPWPLAPGS
jgi:2-keto-4-pentenoate hydratase/2-oxohepta-3-ene-1,7-dioic acid hydratase in catechol pathway